MTRGIETRLTELERRTAPPLPTRPIVIVTRYLDGRVLDANGQRVNDDALAAVFVVEIAEPTPMALCS